MADRLEYEIRHRRGFASGGITGTESVSADFIGNGQSLLEMLDRAQNFSSDLIGCFAVGFENANVRAAARLLMQDVPQLLSLPAFTITDQDYRAVIRAGSSIG